MLNLSHLSSAILDQISTHGYIALFIFLIIEEGGVPMPIPGDVALLFAGFLLSQRQLSFFPTLFYCMAGVAFGATILYTIFERGGRPFAYKHGKYFLLPKRRIHKLERFFAKYGKVAVFLGRLTPGLRVYISAISGLAGTLSYKDFIIQVISASAIWISMFLLAGAYLGEKYVGVVTKLEGKSYLLFVVFIAIIIVEMYRNRNDSGDAVDKPKSI